MADTRVQSLIEVNKKLDELKMNQIKQVETSDALRNDINDRFTDLRNMIAELRPRNFDSQKKPMVQIPAPSTIIRTHPRSPQPPDPPDFNQFGQRFSKYEFPKFDGTSLREWLRRCDEYFCLHRTPPEMKVRVASPHMIGKALQWHTNYIRNNFGIFPSWFDYIIAISGKFGDDDALSMHRASSSPSYKNPYATPLLPPTETIEAPLSKPNFTPKPNEKIPEDQVVQSDSLEDKVDLALIHNSENILEINSIQEHNSLGLTDFILEADCVHPQDLLSKFQVAIPFEEDVVNLRFENKVESIVDGKQLLEAYDGLAIEVMVHVAGKVTVVTDDYDETIQNLIFSCIDESLIREGVNGTQNSNVDLRKSSATVIEKLCATVESMLDYKYHAVWDIAFQVVSAMFDKLGEDSAYFMRKTLKDLSDMQDLPDEGFPYRKQLHECVGSALGAMGPETFLNIVRLNLEASNLSEVKVWLFPILKQYTVGGRLSFFTEIIFRMVETMSHKAQQLKLQGLTVAFRSVDSLVYPLWVLLPSFCNYLVDTVESFADLGLILCGVLQTLAETHGIICASLNIPIQQNEEVVEGKEIPTNDVSPAMLRATARYDSQYAAANLKVLRLCAPKLLDVLSRIFHESGKDDVGSLQSAIGNLASIAEKKTVNDALNTKLRDIKDGINKAARIWGISLCKANVLGIIRYMLLWNIKISMRMYGEDSWLFMMIILKVLCPNEFERESETTKQSFKGLSKLEKDQKRLSPESLGVHILYQFKERKSIEFSEFHNHLKTLLAAIEGLSQKISCGFICGDVKFHLKHRWRSRRLQTLSRLEFCVDNVLIITSHVKVSYSVWRQQIDKFVYGAVRWEKFKQVLDNCQDGSLLELLKRHEAIVDMIMVSYNNVKFFNYIKYLVKSYLVSLLKIQDALKEAKVGKFTMEQFEKSITYLILMLSSEIKYHFELHIQPVKVKIREAVTKTRAQWKEHPPDHFSVFSGHYSSLRTKMF